MIKKDVRIIREYQNEGYCVEVYFNYDASGESYLDDELSNYETLTLDEAEQYIKQLSKLYVIERIGDNTDDYPTFDKHCQECGSLVE